MNSPTNEAQKAPRSIVGREFLDCRRWADTERTDKARGLAGCFWRNRQDTANYERDWPVYRIADNPGMCHRADGTVMARQLGILRVYVNGLDEAGESRQKHTRQTQDSYPSLSPRYVSGWNHALTLTPSLLQNGTPRFRCAMHTFGN